MRLLYQTVKQRKLTTMYRLIKRLQKRDIMHIVHLLDSEDRANGESACSGLKAVPGPTEKNTYSIVSDVDIIYHRPPVQQSQNATGSQYNSQIVNNLVDEYTL
ncbi:uncharacterized protein LOC144453175 [Glandiceps talaboti]